MKNYSIILTALLSLSLIACGVESGEATKKDDDKGGSGVGTGGVGTGVGGTGVGGTGGVGNGATGPIINKALAKAGDTAVMNWLIEGTTTKEGTEITKVAYGSVKGGKFTAASAEDLAMTTQKFLQIGEGETDKIYHNINADAKLLLESGGLEVLYLGTAKPETEAVNLFFSLQAIKADATEAKPVKYTGIVNAQWTNTIPPGIKYFAEKTIAAAGSGTKSQSADVDTTAAPAEVIEGSVEITVDSEGKATITTSGIGNSDDSEDFGWQYDGANLDPASLSDTITNLTEKKVTASKVWKPKNPPVITISAAAISSISVTAVGYTIEFDDIIGLLTKTEVGGKISLTYDAEETTLATTSNLLATADAWQTAAFTNADDIPAGLYSLNSVTKITGQVDLAFVAYTAAE